MIWKSLLIMHSTGSTKASQQRVPQFEGIVAYFGEEYPKYVFFEFSPFRQCSLQFFTDQVFPIKAIRQASRNSPIIKPKNYGNSNSSSIAQKTKPRIVALSGTHPKNLDDTRRYERCESIRQMASKGWEGRCQKAILSAGKSAMLLEVAVCSALRAKTNNGNADDLIISGNRYR